MKTKLTAQSDSTCSQCYGEIPKGGQVIYDVDAFCSEECYGEYLLEVERAEEEL